MSKQKILCVDDDKSILTLLEDALSLKYDVIKAYDGEEALSILEDDKEINIVISDHYMDKMDGLTFFEELKIRRPETYRFLISGYMDLVSVLPKIEAGVVTRFIKKPWSIKSLYRILETTIEH